MGNYEEIIILCYENNNLKYDASKLYIGIEQGAIYLIKNNFENIIAIADFDSVTNDELELIKNKASTFIKLDSNKDKLDAEVAIEYAFKKNVKNISLYITNNNRIDMLFSSIFFANKYNIKVYVDNNLILPLKLNSKILINYDDYCHYQYISVVAIVNSEIKISNMKYNNEKLKLEAFTGNGISNELMENKNGEITLLKGNAVILFIK